MESLDIAKKVLQHVWAEFIDHFDAAANVDHLYSKELIDDSTMDVISNAKSKKDANRAFLSHLRSNATIKSLWKLWDLLRDTVRDHQRHDSLAKSLKDDLNLCKVHLSSPVAAQRGCRGDHEDHGPSTSQSTTSELSNKVFSDEDAASRLGIVAALDLSEGTSQPTVHTDAYLAKDPPHRKLETAFFRLQSHLANIFNEHIADLKVFLCIRQKNEEWPFKELEVEDIDSMKDIRTVFAKICTDWLNTEIFIRLMNVLPDKKSRDDAKRLLEDYLRQLGVFSKCVLLSHIPKHDASLEHFHSCMFPKLRVTYDINMEDFAVSKLLKQQKFLSRTFRIPEEAFLYLEAKPTNSTLVTWALAISIEKARARLFQRVTHEFWSLKEHLIIKVEIESDGIFQLHLKGRNLPYQLKKALQGNQDLFVCTEHVSRQFLALVDYSHLKRKGTEPRLQPALKSVLQPSGPSNVAESETQRQARTGDVMARCGNPSRYTATKPTERDLMVVADRAGSNWIRLLTNLDIPWTTIETIWAESSTNLWMACTRGLVLWLKGGASDSNEPVTFGTLFVALKDSGMADCVSLLVDRLDERPTHEDKDEDPSTPPSERREELQSPTSSLKQGMEPTVSTVEEAVEFFQHNEAKVKSLLFEEVMRLRSQLEAAQRSSTVCSECTAARKEPYRQHISASTLPGRNMPSATGQIVPRNKRSKSCGGPRPRDGRYWAEYQWSSSTPLPEKMFMASAVSVDKAIYIGGGYNASSQQHLTDIYKLDMDSGAWVIMPRRDPEHTTSGFAMAAHKGSLHVIGGEHNARLSRPVSDKVLTLDLSSPAGRWSSRIVQSLTTPRYISGATAHMDHLIVAGGLGEDDEPVPTLEVLSLEGKRRQWTVKMPLRCYARPQLLVHRSKIFVGGDQRDNPEYMAIKTLLSSELFDYIKLSDQQRIRNELSWESNSPQRKGAALFTRNDELMAVGGLKQQAYCCLFNEASMVWENKLPKPDIIQAREKAAAVAVGHEVYILGGKIESEAGHFVPSNEVDLLSVSY